MLPPITKKYCDHSTPKYFKFSFLCDECGVPWESEAYSFSLSGSTPANEDEKSAWDIMWKVEHDAAYERANNEAAFHFSECPKCKRRVCDDCYFVSDDLCTECGKEEHNTLKGA